jgi:hypothetical protein
MGPLKLIEETHSVEYASVVVKCKHRACRRLPKEREAARSMFRQVRRLRNNSAGQATRVQWLTVTPDGVSEILCGSA